METPTRNNRTIPIHEGKTRMTSFRPEVCLILVVDDVSRNLQIIAEILEKVGYEITFASSGQQALERVEIIQPDLILLDLMMPQMNGLEVCEKLKSEPKFSEIPIIFLTASSEQEHLLHAFEKGAVDYVTKPFKTLELLARVRTHLELKYSREQLKKLLQQQKELAKELERLAYTDLLTGIWNRRHLCTLAERELNRAERYNLPLALLIIDIDYFKQVNDTYGHLVGDEVLTAIAQTVQNFLRKVDIFGRFGGEEFLVFLPDTEIRGAVIVAERLRESIAKATILITRQNILVSVSIGVASYKSGDKTIDAMIQRADTALYQAKNQGRNRVVVYSDSE
jgi:diguanylate cyclase (GGDEF)-like protein